MRFVMFRVSSWIVSVRQENEDDPRNHTNQTQTKTRDSSCDLTFEATLAKSADQTRFLNDGRDDLADAALQFAVVGNW